MFQDIDFTLNARKVYVPRMAPSTPAHVKMVFGKLLDEISVLLPLDAPVFDMAPAPTVVESVVDSGPP
ncbi:hypothetical protein BGZ75_001999, partial [Mortierella antarctica]